MHKTMLKATGLLLVLVWSSLASAVGLGGINVGSALGRPLKAEIALVAVEGVDKSSLAVRLASPSDFKNAGIDYPYSLPKLSFDIETKANGDMYVKLTSGQPINDPFVSLLLELSWSSGRVMREYTFLLDPEGFAPEQPKPAAVQPVEPVAPEAAASAVPEEPVPAEVAPVPVMATEGAASEPVTAPVAAQEQEPASAAAPESMAAASGVQPAAAQPDVTPDMEAKDLAGEQTPAPVAMPQKKEPAPAETLTVKRGDTLAKIAAQVKPVDVSLERMVVALYHANRKQFDGHNMNRIRAGKILRVPDEEAVDKVTQKAAVKEIRAQVADWQAYRQKLAAAQGEPADQAPKREDTGKITAAVTEKAPAAKETPKEVLKLSKGEAPGDKQVAGSAMSKQEKRVAGEDDALAKQKQQQEEQKRAEDLKKISEQASKLVELKGAPPAAAASAPAPASAVQPAKPKPAKPKVAMAPPQPVAPPPSLLDDLLGDPIMLGGGVAGLLALGGLGFFVVRRIRNKGGKKKSELKKEFKVEPLGTASGSWTAPVPPSPATGDFTHAPAAPQPAPAAASQVDDIDPIGEAELFLNFGRDAQAEEVLKDALTKNPDHIPVKLKLLSIYANRKDANSFLRYAREIQQSGDNAAWEQVAAQGRSIDPANPIYGGGDTAAAPAQSSAAHEPSVDFDLGFGKPAEPAAPAANKDFAMDFDVTGTHPGVTDVGAHATGGVVDVSGVLPGEVSRAAMDTPMDFDVSGILSPELLKSAQKPDMDFDISSASSVGEISDETVTSMDFDVTGGNVAAKQAEASAPMNFGDLVFEIPEGAAAKPAAAPAPASAPDLDLGMAFSLDLPSGEPATSAPAPDSRLDIDFADINLDLEATAVQPTGAAGAAQDEHWHEVATKLDLAKAYQEMGDAAGAREILEEVLREGDGEQRSLAEKLMQQL